MGRGHTLAGQQIVSLAQADPERVELDADLVQVVANAAAVQAQLQRDLGMFLKGRGYQSTYSLVIEEGGRPVLVRQDPKNGSNGHKPKVG